MWDLNSQPLSHKSNALAAKPPSHYFQKSFYVQLIWYGVWPCMCQRHGQYRKQLWKESKPLKCGYGERWRRSAGRRWLGHVLRHDVLLQDILEGRMTGKCTRGRKRLQLMGNICEGYETAKKRAEDRCLWCVSVMGVSDLLNSRIPEEEAQLISIDTASKNGYMCHFRWSWMTFKVFHLLQAFQVKCFLFHTVLQQSIRFQLTWCIARYQ